MPLPFPDEKGNSVEGGWSEAGGKEAQAGGRDRRGGDAAHQAQDQLQQVARQNWGL